MKKVHSLLFAGVAALTLGATVGAAYSINNSHSVDAAPTEVASVTASTLAKNSPSGNFSWSQKLNENSSYDADIRCTDSSVSSWWVNFSNPNGDYIDSIYIPRIGHRSISSSITITVEVYAGSKKVKTDSITKPSGSIATSTGLTISDLSSLVFSSSVKLNFKPSASGKFGFINDGVITYYGYESHTLTFDKQGGTGGTDSIKVANGMEMPKITPPTREGYAFLGYFATPSSSVMYFDVDGYPERNADSTTKLYAQWDQVATNITLDKQGGNGGTNSVLGIVGQTLPAIAVPTRYGYAFDGYYSHVGGDGTLYYSNDGTSTFVWDSTNPSATFYANWILNSNIKHVVDLIDAIENSIVNTDECHGHITAARNAFNELDEDDQEIISNEYNYQKLWDAERAYDAVVAIAGIGDFISYPTSGDAIYAAKAKVDALSSDQEAMTSNLSSFNSKYDSYISMRDIVVNAVKENIATLGTITYPDSLSAIVAAENAYNSLYHNTTYSVDDRALVDNYSVLAAARARYDELEAAYNAAQPVIEKISAIGEVGYPTSKNAITQARDAYNALSSDDERNFVTNYATLEAAEARYEELRLEAIADVIGKISDIPSPVVYTQACYDAINAAIDAYDALGSDGDKSEVTNYSTLEAAIVDFYNLAQDKIDEVKTKINAIGTVEYTAECKALIDDARSAFEALLGNNKEALVTNYQTLVDAEAAYKALDDQAKADAVKELIKAIGEVKYPDSGEAIEAARKGYDALDKDQKELVTNYQTLLDAEATYAQLELDATRHEIKDEESGVTVATSDGTGIPKNINLKVEVKTNVKAQEGSVEYDKIKSFLTGDEKISNVFDVKLIKTEGGVESEIQPSDIKEGMKLIVTITLPEGINVNDLKILHIHNDSSIEFVENFKVDGNKVSFEVSSLSELAFIQKANTGLPGWAIALIVVGGVLLLLCLLYILFMFVFNKWCIKDNKVVRAIRLWEKQGRYKVILFPFSLTSRLESAVFSSKEAAEKYLGK